MKDFIGKKIICNNEVLEISSVKFFYEANGLVVEIECLAKTKGDDLGFYISYDKYEDLRKGKTIHFDNNEVVIPYYCDERNEQGYAKIKGSGMKKYIGIALCVTGIIGFVIFSFVVFCKELGIFEILILIMTLGVCLTDEDKDE